mgnify:CR=1 FL=1
MPAWLRYMFSNNFRNPLGVCAIGGTFGTPLFLYCRAHQVLPDVLDAFDTPLLYFAWCCKALAMACEAWLIQSYAHRILYRDALLRSKRKL